MRKASLRGVVSLLLRSHVSRLFTFSSFEGTPSQDAIRGVGFSQAYTLLFDILLGCCGVKEANK